MLAKAEVELVSLSFTPSTVDVGQATQTLTFTAHLRSDGDPIQQAVVFFEYGSGRSYQREGYYILADHLVSGDLHDGIFEVSYQITSWMRVGVWKLNYAYVADSTSHTSYYGRSVTTPDEIANELGWPDLPETVQTDLTIIADSATSFIGIEYTLGSENVFQFGETEYVQCPFFSNEEGQFHPSAPGSDSPVIIVPRLDSSARRHGFACGESRSMMVFCCASQQFAGTDMFVFYELKPGSSGYLQPGIKVRLARFWTEDYFRGQGDVQRVVTLPVEDELASGQRYRISMREDGTNAITWSTTVGFLVTPPPGGFTSDFVMAFGNHSYGNRTLSSGAVIIFDSVAVIGNVNFKVVDASGPSIRSDNVTKDCVISWFGGAANLLCHVQWSRTLEPDDWTTAEVTKTGWDGMLNWTDDGSSTAPMSEPRRFYRILVP